MNNQPCKITATVERVRWPKDAPESAVNAKQFYILATSAGVAKGCLTHRPRSGEALVLDGRWEVSKYNGQPEFVFVHAAVNVPADPRALLHYACTLTPSFGDAREAAIWQARGEDWRNLSLDDNIRGVTPSALEAFRKTIAFLTSHSARASSVAWLVSIGLTVNMADAAVDKFGDEVVARVTADPYILASLPHYSFKAADDHLRPFFKIDRDSPLRIRAALRYALASLLESNTAVTWRELSAATVALIDSDVDAISAIARQMIQSNELCAFARTERLTLLRLFVAEAEIYRYIAGNVVYKDAPRARQPRGCGFKLDADQMAAVQFAVQHRFAIINGSAGTGKTSIVRAICDTLGGEIVWLCAFAGKAAARLREATGHDASTIHRMLGWQGEGRGFTLSTFPPRTTVVVDEASMVASDLMAEIVKRSPYQLILVGDEAQLPPVGSGQPFHDAIALFPACVRTLGLCYRNREAVFASALAVRNGFMPPASAKSDAELYEFVSTRSPADSHLAILSAVRSGAVDFDSDIILVCRNGENTTDPLTVQALNADIKSIVNPAPDGRIAITPGDRVMCVKNCADLDVWNGTTGRCRGFDCDRAMWVGLDYPNAAGETSVLIPKEKVKEWVLAYALTVHKAQGSQYRRVWIGISRRDIPSRLLDRAMLYTAITRAKSECRIIGDTWAFASAVGLVPTKHTVMQELARETKDKEAK